MSHLFRSTFIAVISFWACVPISRYEQAQYELQKAKESNLHAKLQHDSLSHDLQVIKADYNNLMYELGETQRYSSFTDLELIKQLNKERAEKEKFEQLAKHHEIEKNITAFWGHKRATAFASDLECSLGSFTRHKFVLVKNNLVLMDIEGLLLNSKENQVELKSALISSLGVLQKRNDWTLNVSLYQAGVNSDWSKIQLQSEVLNFLVSDVAFAPSKVEGITRIVTHEKSPDFGVKTQSRLLLEFEFRG